VNAKFLRRWLSLAAPLALVGCGVADVNINQEGQGPDTETDPTQQNESALRESTAFDAEFQAAGREFDVPAALLKAIAWAETRYEMVRGEPEFEGQPVRSGVMALWGAQLVEGAALAKVTAQQAQTEPLANIRAAAAYLALQAERAQIDRLDLAAWAEVLGAYSNIEQPEARRAFARDEVLAAFERGVGRLSSELKASGTLKPLPTANQDTRQISQSLSAGPDYAPAIWRPSPNFNSRNGVSPAMVIIHTCEGAYSGCWGWLTNSASGVSAHYVVSTGSEVSQLVRESSRAWHIGASYDCNLNSNVDCSRNGTSSNNFTIGIEHAGFSSQSSFPAAQLDASARLTCNITRDQGIPRDRFHVVAHGQLQPATRTDPGPNWPWADYLNRINAACGTTPPPPPSGTLIIDSNNAQNNQAAGYIQVSSNWISASSASGLYGTGYYFAQTAPVSDGATFFFKLDTAGRRTIDAWWTEGANRSAAAPFVAFDAQGANLGTVNVDQRTNGGAWRTLGTFDFTAGWNRVVLSRWAAEGSVVIADALRVR
jgi:N-acetyl-anhydromuramyl-L-alanine amidase AmpD